MADNERTHKIQMLRGAAEGARMAHVWRSPQYPGADMVVQYRWPEVEIEPGEHGLPSAFAEDVELEYAGTLTKQEAARKLADMRVAAQVAEAPDIAA